MLFVLYVGSTLSKTRNQTYKMANASPFERALLDKMDALDNKNNTSPMKYAITKEAWSMFLTDEGKAYLTRNDNLRNVMKCKVLEVMERPSAENEVQLQAVSWAVLTVIANINLGKNL